MKKDRGVSKFLREISESKANLISADIGCFEIARRLRRNEKALRAACGSKRKKYHSVLFC